STPPRPACRFSALGPCVLQSHSFERHTPEQRLAKIVGGIATSHTPTIGFALDTGKQKDPVWAPIFEGYKPVQEWLAAKRPDVLFFIYNDHVTSFFFDHYSHFALGIGESYPVADE